MSDTEQRDRSQSEDAVNFYHLMVEAYNEAIGLPEGAEEQGAALAAAGLFSQLSLAESKYEEMAIARGEYAFSLATWIWQPAEDMDISLEQIMDPTSTAWMDVVPQMIKRLAKLRFPDKTFDD